VARTRLYVAQGSNAVVISRHRLRTVGGRVVERGWTGLVETVSARLDPEPPRAASDAAIVVLPPLLITLIVMAIGGLMFGLLAGIILFFVTSYLRPTARRAQALRVRRSTADATRVLKGDEQAIFAQAIRTADRISDTWPALGALVDVAEAEAMLVEALWELSEVLAKRHELRRVVADLSRPEFTGLPADDDTVRQLHRHRHTARLALADIDAEIARREASLARAEKAGIDFIRDQEMRRAIRAAEQSLEGLLPAASEQGVPAAADSGAGLAERTATVLAAYRELTAGPYQPPPGGLAV
jgi:hypothetical protein